MNRAVLRVSIATYTRSLAPDTLTRRRLSAKARVTARSRSHDSGRGTNVAVTRMGPPLPSRELGHVAGSKDAAVTLAVWLVGRERGGAHLARARRFVQLLSRVARPVVTGQYSPLPGSPKPCSHHSEKFFFLHKICFLVKSFQGCPLRRTDPTRRTTRVPFAKSSTTPSPRKSCPTTATSSSL